MSGFGKSFGLMLAFCVLILVICISLGVILEVLGI